MKKNDFSKKTDKDLQALLKEKYDALRAFRFGGSGAKARDVKEGRNLRKDIARAKTVIRAREIEAAKK